MYVCLCNAITERALREAAEDGPLSVEAAYARLGAELQCGQCAGDASDILCRRQQTGDDRAAPEPPDRPLSPLFSPAAE